MKKIFDTSTKYYTENMKGAPSLSWEWGSLNSVLKTILVDGITLNMPISGFTFNRDKKELKLLTPNPDSILVNSVIKLSGHSDERINREFRVSRLLYDSIIVNVEEDLSGIASAPVTLDIPSLGWEVAYNNSGTTVYRNKNVEYPCAIKVIDKSPGNGYQDTWARFARVQGGKIVNDNDGTFREGKYFPYLNSYPDASITGNKVAGSGGIHGWTKWYYATRSHSTSGSFETASIESVKKDFPTSWYIIGDKDSFYIGIKQSGKTQPGYISYGFGLFEDYGLNYDIFLTCSEHWATAGSTLSGYNNSLYSVGNSFTGMFADPYGCFSYSTATGAYSKDKTTLSSFALTSEITSIKRYSPPMQQGDGFNPVSGKILTSPVYIKQVYPSVNIRGKYRGVQLPVCYNSSPSLSFIDDSISFNVAAFNYINSEVDWMNLFFSLEKWN